MVKALSSMKLTVVLFFFLSLLTFWGTLYQVEHGLYLAQEKFFNSYFLFLGPVAFPSARTVLWLFSLNLIFTLIFRFNFTWKNLGINISHLGMLLLLISGFLTLNFSQESYINLTEGEARNFSSDYHKWQLILIDGEQKYIFPSKLFKKQSLLEGKLEIEKYYKNSAFFDTPFAGQIIKELKTEKDYELNVPALFLKYTSQAQEELIEMHGNSKPSASLIVDGKELIFLLRKKTYKLPFSVTLSNVERVLHSGTEKAKSYKSDVVIKDSKYSRDFTISMNKPFRYGLYTLYQSGFGVNQDGQEFTVLAVAKNINYWLPYVATVIASLGLFINFAAQIMFRRES